MRVDSDGFLSASVVGETTRFAEVEPGVYTAVRVGAPPDAATTMRIVPPTLFPKQATNAYEGSPIALWVFAAITVVTLVRSLIHVFAPDGGAASIATVPLDAFTVGGAVTVVHVCGLWGLSQLLMALVGVVVLWRYRNMVPLMYALLVVEYAGRLLLTRFKPIELAGTAPGAIANYVLVPLAIVMLVLALWRRPT